MNKNIYKTKWFWKEVAFFVAIAPFVYGIFAVLALI